MCRIRLFDLLGGCYFDISAPKAPEKSVAKESSKRLRTPGWGYGYGDVQLSTALPFCGDLMRKKNRYRCAHWVNVGTIWINLVHIPTPWSVGDEYS